ncbi:DUF1905 domain-containing protein [Vagococcus carniphilus]|uniref:DUF1905 domain-containing protein n=1 Tax=Vagococcus carniphilus TaxID=218144 RepID=UPI0028921249|nr:DUF1905 domain-containing protein [Vagococcus carniphilus]MDT2840226.1 DUF1905 domain-containing protein [Vagococcus carniphilus]
MSEKIYQFNSLIYSSEVGKGGAYIIFPYDIREEFGKGRVKVQVDFEGVPYEGSIVNMGVKDNDGNICYIISIKKDIRNRLNKEVGDTINVKVQERKDE